MVNIDFSKRTAVTGSQKSREREYWLEKFSGDPVKTGFYKDYKNPVSGKGKLESVKFGITGEFFSRLTALRNGSDHRLHMILTAGLAVLLSKHTGSSDIILGAPIYKQAIQGDFINTVLALRNQVEPHMTFKELLMQVRQTLFEAAEHQNYPIEILMDQLDMPFSEEGFPLFDIAILLENIHDVSYLQHIPLDMIFSFLRTGDVLEGTVQYHAHLYERSGIESIVSQYTRLLETAVFNVDLPIAEIPILSEEEKNRLLFAFGGINVNRKNSHWKSEKKMVHQKFEEQAAKTPNNIAIICTDSQVGEHWHVPVTYRELNEKANRLAHFLGTRMHIRPEERVGILMVSSIECAAAMLAVLKAGGAYVPIDPSLPDERKIHIIDDAEIGVVISRGKYTRTLNRLQWECSTFHSFICLDTHDVYAVEGVDNGEWIEDKRLWEYVGETASDDITGGGWLTGYTGQPFTKQEMDEYGDNVLKKLSPLLHKKMRVLEIGCASGLTMYRIAPKVGFYYAVDLSEVIIRKNKERAAKEGHRNICLECLPAHEIDTVGEKNFDLVIINSVIQDFYGHNYLRSVIAKAATLIKEKGHLFIGDVMDLQLKEELVKEMKAFKRLSAEQGKDYRTKTDWSSELFVSREFFEDLPAEVPWVQGVEFSRKIYTIENELTKFRFDCLITVDRTRENFGRERQKHKYQYDAGVLATFAKKNPRSRVKPHNLAYIIYTSGTTGIPNGVMIEHRNVSSTIGWFTRTYDFGVDTNVLQVANISFDVSVEEIFGTLTRGATLYIAGKETLLDKDQLVSFIKKHNINVVQFVPAALKAFLADVPKVECLRVVICGGDALEESLKNTILSRGYRLYNHYGPTEVTVDAVAGQCDGFPVNIGKPIDDVQVYVVDHTGYLQPVGVPGELLVGGAGLAREYLHNPKKTREKFVPISEAIRWLPREYLEKLALQTHETRVYRTGDMVRWKENGILEFIGRKDQQVKIRGFRIEPAEIETHLRNHERIEDAVVASAAGEGGDSYLCAYILWAPNTGERDTTEIRDYLAALLPDYMVPAYFMSLDRIPLTSSGKVSREKLPPVETVSATDGYRAPQDEIEKKLVDIWSEILNIEKSIIGIDENFFQLGGHSLKATILVSNIHKVLDVKIPLAEIFRTPNIRALAQYIRRTAKTEYISMTPVEEKEYYRLSSAQERLYAMHQLGTDTSYNTPQVVEIRGDLDIEKFEAAFHQLIKRHESLRTSFELKDEKPVQRIHDHVEFNIEVKVEEEVEEAARFIRPFDLSKAPLMRVGLIKKEESKHVLIIDMHHIITDGVSDDIFVRDFAALYRGEGLPFLRLRYRDYCRWQNSGEHRQVLNAQEAYWLEQFEDGVPVIDLPLDYPRPRVQTFAGELMGFSIGEELTRQVNAFIEEEKDTTLYMVLSAVFNILLSRYSGQDDIVVGFPITGRTHADLDNIIGMFINMLALRNRVEPGKRFREFLHEVKKNALDAYSNQDYPYSRLVEVLGIKRNPGQNPLFDCVFSFREIDEGETGHVDLGPGLRILPYEFGSSVSKFDLQLRGMAGGDRISMALEYKTALFKRETIEEMKRHFIEILEQVMDDVDIKLGDVVFSSDLVLGITGSGVEEEVEFNF